MNVNVMDDNALLDIERNIGQPTVEPVRFQAGRFSIINCGAGGWIKINIEPEVSWHDVHSELLPPQAAHALLAWISKLIN